MRLYKRSGQGERNARTPAKTVRSEAKKNLGTRHGSYMKQQELRDRFPGWWWQGTGNFALCCPSGRRITLFTSLEIAKEAKHSSCGRNCDRYMTPHFGVTLDAAPTATQRTGLTPGFRRWMESE